MKPETGSMRYFKTGEIIMRQGEKGLCAYIIEEGTVEVVIEGPDGPTNWVVTRGPGSIVGEMSLVDEAPRVATVRALEDCKMLEITQSDFSKHLKSTDPLIQMITQVILTRFRDTLTRSRILREEFVTPPVETLERLHIVQNDAVAAIRLATEFKQALADGDLVLHYQPIIDLVSGAIVGFEALMRWTHAEKGYISPGVFIPIAEKSDLIVEASQWVLRESCHALKRLEKSYPSRCKDQGRRPYISINISGADLAYEGFTDNLFNTLRETDLQPDQVTLEITERLLIEQPRNANNVLRKCRDAGIDIAIDDFGTGYSSLSYLHYFRIDTLKIDRCFIRDMASQEPTFELVKSIISLGKSMNMKVIAEGTEDSGEARTLRAIGCDMAQGFHFARPMPESEVRDLLQSWTPARVQ